MALKKQITHDCIYEEKINQMHKIITGNGDPEHSMVSQMVLLNDRVQYLIDAKKRTWPLVLKVIGTIAAIVMVYIGYKNLTSAQRHIQSETKAINENLAPVLRGGSYNPFAVDTVRKKPAYDTVNIDLIINSLK